MPEASRVSTPVTQVGHGFTRGDAVQFDGVNWVLASTGGTSVGIAGSLFDANSFEFIQLGELDGLDDLVPGSLYYPAESGISTTVNGSPIGMAYTDSVLFVGMTSGASTSSGPTVSAGIYVSVTQAASMIASAIALQVLQDSVNRLHSVELDAVISVTPGHSGVVFLESDGTQVLTG